MYTLFESSLCFLDVDSITVITNKFISSVFPCFSCFVNSFESCSNSLEIEYIGIIFFKNLVKVFLGYSYYITSVQYIFLLEKQVWSFLRVALFLKKKLQKLLIILLLTRPLTHVLICEPQPIWLFELDLGSSILSLFKVNFSWIHKIEFNHFNNDFAKILLSAGFQLSLTGLNWAKEP